MQYALTFDRCQNLWLVRAPNGDVLETFTAYRPARAARDWYRLNGTHT